jgi:hypothetical protein
MITIVAFKWIKDNQGYRLNSGAYTHEHVNRLYYSLKRNTTIPFRFICVTDDSDNIDKEIEILTLWDICRNLGGCYNRLFIFSKEIEKFFGKRFLAIDLDCVIVNNIDSILQKSDDFLINKFIGKNNFDQLYNGGMIMMNTGSRSQVWSKFEFEKSVKILDEIKKDKNLIGSDQAWIQYILGDEEKTFNTEDGIYSYSFLENKQNLPENAKIIFFPGRIDPSTELNSVDWIKTNWR